MKFRANFEEIFQKIFLKEIPKVNLPVRNLLKKCSNKLSKKIPNVISVAMFEARYTGFPEGLRNTSYNFTETYICVF